jgi:hypothetical protein
VGPKHFQDKARREWWSIHIEAWQRSGLSQRRYCRMHRLTGTTFTRWLRAITDAEAAKIRAQNAKILAETERDERRRQRRGRPFKLTANKRSQAVQAFWAMHVETLNWSGMTLTHYAAATKLSRSSLRRWRDLIDGGEIEIDWRVQLHPSARPKISSGASSAAKERSTETVLTASPPGDPPRDRRSNRRRFTDEEKLAIVLEAEQPGVSVAAVCRHHDIVASMVFRWESSSGSDQTTAQTTTAAEAAAFDQVTPLLCGGDGVHQGRQVLRRTARASWVPEHASGRVRRSRR